LSWLTPSLGHVDALTPIAAAPPNLYDETCGPNRRRPAAESEEEEVAQNGETENGNGIALSSLQTPKAASLIGPLVPSMPPIVVTVGPVRQAAPAVVAAPLPPPRPAGPRTETASIDRTAPGSAAALAPTLGGTDIIQSATFSSTALASNPPAAFAPTRQENAVPMPRARPRAVARVKKRRR
jgi:D-alanyl-D-alanine carboxypeptidase